MLDVFVVVLLVGMIHFGPFAGVEPRVGAAGLRRGGGADHARRLQFRPAAVWPDPTDNPPASAPPIAHE
jgi:paraquat-inducible protein A